MSLSIIVAVASNGVIGSENDMPWHISEDLKRFKRLTLGKKIIMGRKTWESLPFKPLKNRENIVLTRSKDFKAEGAVVVHSLADALALLDNEEEAFIIGGGNIYKQALPFTQKLYITEVHSEYEGDTLFPEIDPMLWKESSREYFSNSANLPAYSFVIYISKK